MWWRRSIQCLSKVITRNQGQNKVVAFKDIGKIASRSNVYLDWILDQESCDILTDGICILLSHRVSCILIFISLLIEK